MNPYYNLKTAMNRDGVTQEDLAQLIGSHRNTVDGKINGKVDSGFGINESVLIRDVKFPQYRLEWLFYREPAQESA